jgi:hypothetical protein
LPATLAADEAADAGFLPLDAAGNGCGGQLALERAAVQPPAAALRFHQVVLAAEFTGPAGDDAADVPMRAGGVMERRQVEVAHEPGDGAGHAFPYLVVAGAVGIQQQDLPAPAGQEGGDDETGGAGSGDDDIPHDGTAVALG